jgi:hypothetical protein
MLCNSEIICYSSFYRGFSSAGLPGRSSFGTQRSQVQFLSARLFVMGQAKLFGWLGCGRREGRLAGGYGPT